MTDMDDYTRMKRGFEAAGFKEEGHGNFTNVMFIRASGKVEPCLETADDRVRRYLALLDLHSGTQEDSPDDIYVRLDVAYEALSGQEMERVERILRGEEPRP